MRRIASLFILFLTTCVVATAKPYRVDEVPNVQLANRHHYTSNPDGILSEDAVQAIDAACDSLRTNNIAEVAVVAIRDIASDDVFTFAHQLFSSWGVGSSKNDNGLGIILVLDKREIRFVTGHGLEGVLPDAICKRIQQNYMVGHLGDGNYDKGMVDGVAAVATLLSSGELPTSPEDELTTSDIIAILGSMLVIFVLFVLLIYVVYRAAHRCPKCGKHHIKQTDSQLIKNALTYQIIDRRFICPDCGHSFVKRVRQEKATVIMTGRGGRGGFGGGNFGGGFGGGSFGGGGAGSRF